MFRSPLAIPLLIVTLLGSLAPSSLAATEHPPAPVAASADPAPATASEAPILLGAGISAMRQRFERVVEPSPRASGEAALPCTVSLSWLVLRGPLTARGITAAINAELLRPVLTEPGDGQTCPTVEAAVATFVAQYEAQLRDLPDHPGGWAWQVESKVRHADAVLLSVELDSYWNTGGAHPNSRLEYQVWSLATGERVKLAEIVPAARLPELTAIAEPHFRQARNLTATESYPDHGIAFDQQPTFALNDNFLVSTEGLSFCFNPYEIGPYALGRTTFTVPWAELTGLVDPKGPAGAFLPR